MRNIQWKSFRMPAVLVVIFIAASLFSQWSYAEDAICVFVFQKDSAWVVRKDATVKQSLKVGDSLYDGDKLIVLHGNTVQLSFDREAKNVMQIEGDTELQISGAKPTNIDMSSGKIFAVLNKKGPESLFRVSTPTAVAAVRGTQFQVNVAGQQSNILTYQGSVRVSSRDASGKELPSFVMVDAGQKTSVPSAGIPPKPAQVLTETEKHDIDGVLSKIEESKKVIADGANAKWFEKEKKTAKSSSDTKTAEKHGSEKGRLIL